MDRRRYWKEQFEEAWRRGDPAGMVRAEEMLEAYTMLDSLELQERSEAAQQGRQE